MMIQNYVSNSQYRSATGCFNPTTNPVTVEFSLYCLCGGQIGSTITRTLVGNDFQAFNPFTAAGLIYPTFTYDSSWLRIKPVSGTGEVITFGATANNTTNDPAAHIAVQAGAGYANSPSSKQIMPEVIWAPASGGGTWKTQVQITDTTGGSQVTVTFSYGGGNRRGPFLLWDNSIGAAFTSVKYDNLLESIEALDSGFTYYGTVGAVEMETQSGSHTFFSSARTANGNYSKTLPGFPLTEDFVAGTGSHLMIQNLESNDSYRTAIGCFNPTSDSVTVEFKLIDSYGFQIGSTIILTFVGYDYQPFNPFIAAGQPYPTYSHDNVWLKITPTSGAGIITAIGATANNTTNDPASHVPVHYK
jgi:hypothetical protein